MDESFNLRVFSKMCEQINNIKGTNYKLHISDKIGRDIHKQKKMIITTTTDTKTNLEYSLAHVLYDSQVPKTEQIKKLVDCKEHGYEYIIEEIMYTLEAERVEYNWGEIYYGSRLQFERQRKERVSKGDINPISAIQYARNGDIEDLKNTEWAEAINVVKGVHGYDYRMTIRLAIDYFNKYIKDWMKQGILEKYDKMVEKYDKPNQNNIRSIPTNELHDFNCYMLDYKKTQELGRALNEQDNMEIKLNPTDFSNRTKQKIWENNGKRSPEKTTESVLNMDMKDLEKSSKRKTDNITSKMRYMYADRNPITKSNFKVFKSNRTEDDYDIDYHTARKLEKMFAHIRSIKTHKYDQYGDIIDIDEYIQNTISNDIEYWDIEKKEIGLTIIIGIDLSGSMSNMSVKICRDMCGTILQATRKLKNVNVIFVPWSTSNDEHDLTVDEVTTFEGISHITKNRHVQNANDLAHRYLDDVAQRYKGKKVIIMMTDGEPFCYGIKPDVLLANTKLAIAQSKHRGMQVYGVYLGFRSEEEMRGMYKNDFVSCRTAEQVSDAIIKLVKKHVLKALQQ